MKKIGYINDFDKWRSSFTFYIPITIRFSETDMFGHMSNVSSFIYFEQARIEFLKAAGVELNKNSDGLPVVSDLECDYHQQLYFDDTLYIYVKAHQVGTTSMDLHYMALNENKEICLTGRGRLVFVKPDTGSPTPLNDKIKERFKTL